MSQPTSPSSNRKNLVCRVLMLDDAEEIIYVPNKSLGGVLFMKVVEKLQLLEADYFDLQYKNVEGVVCWLDHEKPVTSHMPQNSLNFEFVVKFYTPDPGMLEEEVTRYLFALQVKRDLSTGRMHCQEQTAALLASYIVQAEYGDLTDEGFEANPGYLKSIKLFPNMGAETESRIVQHHREHFGQTPNEADYNLLDTARKVEFYGISMHDAKDHEGVALHLAVTHMGVVVFQNMTRINTFSWAKIRKLSFKRKKFLVKLHPEGYGFYKDTVEFYFRSRNECKNFWKKCLEHHAFFRCQSVKKIPRNKTRVVSHGSSFRYSGKTQKQLVDFVRENFSKRPNSFLRSTSMRTVNFGDGVTPRTGTLRSLRHSHQPHHESPQQFDEKPDVPESQLFSPAKRDSRSSGSFQPLAQNGTSSFISMQKNSHTLPKESKPSTSGENGQSRSGEGEKASTKAQPAKDSEQNLQATERSEIHLGQATAELGQVVVGSPDGGKFPEMEETAGTTSRPSSMFLNPHPNLIVTNNNNNNNVNNIINTNNNSNNGSQTLRTPHEQFQFFPEVQQSNQKPNQQNFLPPSPTAIFPKYSSASLLDNQSAQAQESFAVLNFSKSLSIQISQDSCQPRYFSTDVDTSEVVTHDSGRGSRPLSGGPSESSVRLQHFPSSEGSAALATNFDESLRTSCTRPHESSEVANLSSLRPPQQPIKCHSTDFISSGKVPLIQTETWNGRSSLLAPPTDHPTLTRTAGIGSCGADDTNLLSLSGYTNSSQSTELTLPTIRNQIDGSNESVIKKVISIPGYYIGRELLMTERTYRRDLEILCQGFQQMATDMEAAASPVAHQTSLVVVREVVQLFSPMVHFHSEFLQAVEMRISEWENFCTSFEKRKIGDLFATNISMLRMYNNYLSRQDGMMSKIYSGLQKDSLFRETFLKFESSRTCYQPVSAFLLKPYQKLSHYACILNKFIEICGNDHEDLENCEESRAAILDVCNSFREVHLQMINLQKLCQLQQNVVGMSDLLQSRPHFIREGCLQKLSDNGYHQRIFILFDDLLVYANRKITGNFQFVVHAHIPMENLQVEVFKKVNNNNISGSRGSGYYGDHHHHHHHYHHQDDALINNGFLIRIFGNDARVMEVAASSVVEKTKWIEDLNAAVSSARRKREIMSRKNFFDSTERLFGGQTTPDPRSPPAPLSPFALSPFALAPLSPPALSLQPSSSSSSSYQPKHTNTMTFVCWHRNTSVCMPERVLAVKNHLSGFLLRKFKTSLGWQKLWVAFSNLCLFFYKSHKDEFPLASLPLLGYSISVASQSDGIDKNFVFKLTFKSHAYFFRAESQYTYERWMEVISSTIESSRHFRLFSRLESLPISPG